MIKPDRLAERMEHCDNMSQAELGRRAGVSQQAIGKILSGETKRSGHLTAIARELRTTAAYLMGETDDPSEGAIAPPSPSLIAEQLDAVMIREVDIELSMGGGSINDELPVQRLVPLPRSWLATMTDASPSDLIVARGEGDSMVPTILDGDLVVINTGEKTMRKADRIWALSYGEFGMIKRVRALHGGQLQINSDNQAVSPILAAPDEVHTIGRVVAIVRRV